MVASFASESNVQYIMSGILGTMFFLLYVLVFIQDPIPRKKSESNNFLPDPKLHPSKHAYELFIWRYTVIWISCFSCVVIFQLYEKFTATHYNLFLIGLALPLFIQPIFYPQIKTLQGRLSPDATRSLFRRYSLKANIWIAIFSFIGNYWYTHYFYSVLRAKYTFPANRLNDVPLCLYFATHFYFSTYHALSNNCLRRVTMSFKSGMKRDLLFVAVIIVLSYATAFMETLSISSFPYYEFENRDKAYTVGSAFYGIYFLVSFPMFYFFDEEVDRALSCEEKDENNNEPDGIPIWRTVVDSCGCGMIVLCLLDFVRLYIKIPLQIGTP